MPSMKLDFPFCVTEFNSSTAIKALAFRKTSKFSVISRCMAHPTKIEIGMMKSAIWIEHPIAITEALSSLFPHASPICKMCYRVAHQWKENEADERPADVVSRSDLVEGINEKSGRCC